MQYEPSVASCSLTLCSYDAGTDSWMSVPLPPNLPTSRAFLTASVVQPF